MVDITNLYYHDIHKKSIFDEGFKTKIRKIFSETNFGSLFLSGFFVDNKGHGYHWHRFDNESIDNHLRLFLDKYFPFENVSKDTFTVFNQG